MCKGATIVPDSCQLAAGTKEFPRMVALLIAADLSHLRLDVDMLRILQRVCLCQCVTYWDFSVITEGES